MKKLFQFSLLLTLLSVSVSGHALEGQGTVEEIRVCSVGNSSHKNVFFYRLSDGTWFGAYTHFHDANHAYSGDTAVQSTILMAYSTGQVVKVRATYDTHNRCGVSAAMQWSAEGDYVILSKDNQL